MQCKECADKLDRFVDRELSSTEVLELELHLESWCGTRATATRHLRFAKNFVSY